MATRLIETGSIDIEAIKDQYPLASIVEQHVSLKRKGNLHEGLCPFHEERSPSFKVYEDQHYYCFGCAAYGDIFDFLEHMEGLNLRAAAERLTGGSYPVYSADRIEELRAKRAAFEAQQRALQQRAIDDCRRKWHAATPVDIHPYLTAKGIKPSGARLDDHGRLLIPLLGDDGKIQTLQTIDADGRKLFVSDAPVTGGLFVIGGKVAASATPVLLCEGFATAASLHEATGYVTVCAFNSGNLAHVAGRIRARYPDKEYVVCGDDDRFKTKNPGKDAAYAAASILGCEVNFPVFSESSTGTDFNDMAADYGLEGVRDLIVDGILPSGEKTAPDFGEVFAMLDIDELESLPPPTWLIDDLIADHGLSIVYGEAGSYKSFIVLDMTLRLAHGLDWHGIGAKKVGVLYIAGEGSRGLGKRVKGWRQHHGMTDKRAPFLLLPEAVQMIDDDARAKLRRSIDAAKARVSFNIGLIVIDTVSRSIAGQDENAQESMSLFVNGCADLQAHSGGAVIGVHHSGKDGSRGMRGSTVLIGACDASLKVSKDEMGTVTIEVEKQKDAEQAGPFYMTMKKVEWVQGLENEQDTLVPVKGEKIKSQTRHLTVREANQVLAMVADDWAKKSPWSINVQAKRRAKYLPSKIATMFQITEPHALSYIIEWQDNGYLLHDMCDDRKSVTGLRVLKMLEE